MATPLIQPSFAAGEVTPALHSRVDLAKYHVALATCLNFFIRGQGGAYNRPGTAFVDSVLDHTRRGRLITFEFRTLPAGQNYALEFGHQKMRVIKDGAYVLEAAKTITGITQANPAVVTSNAHGFSNGDEVFIADVVGMTQVNGQRFVVAGAAANTFQLQGVDSTGYGAYVSGGTASRYYTLATPYVEADLPTLKFVQSADTMTLTHPNYETRDLTRTGHASWTLTVVTFAAQMPAPTGLVGGPSAPPVGATQNYEYVVTAISADTGEESLPSAPVTVVFEIEQNWGAGEYINLQWNNVAGASSYNVYKKRNGIFGLIGNAADGTLVPFGFQDDKIKAGTSDTPPTHRNPFNAPGEYPGCVTYHEERRFFAASTNKPQTIWGTASGNYRNMNVSAPTKDEDAITRTLTGRKVNEIRHLVSMSVLIALTSGSEWRVRPGGTAPVLTPAAFDSKPQTFDGCSHVPPLQINDSVLFIQEKGSIVRDLRYQFSTDGYGGIDLSLLAAHMFDGFLIEEWAHAKVPFNLVWAVRNDGTLLSFGYIKEQEFYAWSRHTTDGVFESVCTVSEGLEDAVYVIVRRTIGGQTRRYVERFKSRAFTLVRDAWFFDSALAYDGNNTDTTKLLKITGASYLMGASVTLQATGHTPFSAALIGRKYELRKGTAKVRVTITAVTDSDTATATLDTNAAAALQNVDLSDWALLATTVSGLWHLEGKTVHILGDGNIMPPQVVTNGAVPLERACSKAICGLPYEGDLETLDIDAGQPTVQDKEKRVSRVTLSLERTRGLKVGPVATDGGGEPMLGTPGTLNEMKDRTTENYGEPTRLTTGKRRVGIDPNWNSSGRIFIRTTPGLPAAILAIIPRVTAGD